MIVEEIINCLSIIGVGLLILRLILKFFHLKIQKLSYPERVVYVITFFSALYVIPMAFLGLHEQRIFFQLWPLILAVIGLLNLGYLISSKYKNIILHLEEIGTNSFLKNKFRTIRTNEFLLALIIILLLFAYTIFNLILPFRDFDAIWMYIPDAIWYYRVNFIPEINPLNFRLSTKEPLVSLLFTYTLYTTGDLNIKLLPVLFVLGWVLTVYIFIQKLWKDQSKSLMGVLLFLISPFIYYIFNFWVYYQEIYVSFFFSVTMLSLFNIFDMNNEVSTESKTKEKLFYLMVGSLSFALTLLSKLSGWSLIFLIILVIPFTKKGRIIQSLVIIGLTIFLMIKVSIDYYIGFGLVLLVYLLVLLFLIWRHPFPPVLQNTRNYSNWISLMIIPIGLLLGGFWLITTFQEFSQYGTSVQSMYFTIPNFNIKTNFIGTALNSPHFLLESAHSVDFISIAFYLIIGNMFVLFWLFPKLRVLFDSEVKFFVLWTIGFFMLWITYQGFTSVRYLSVILVPMIIIVTHGFQKLYSDIKKKPQKVTIPVIIFASFLALTSYYYPISPSIITNGINPQAINQEFLLSAYNYYKNSLFYLSLTIIFSFFFIFSYKKWPEKFSYKKEFSPITVRTVKVFLLIILLFVPFIIPLAVFTSVDGNINDFNGTFVYYQRPAYQEVVNELLNENSPTSGILAFDLPGLSIYTNQPTADLFVQQDELHPLFTNNISAILQILENPLEYARNNFNLTINTNLASSTFSFDYLVMPNYGNNLYTYYASSIFNKSYLFPLLFQKSLFKNIYQNNEFIIFKRTFTIPSFYGVVNSFLTDSKQITSLIGQVQLPTKFSNNLGIGLTCSIPAKKDSLLSINTTIALKNLYTTMLVNSTENFTTTIDYPIFSYTIPIVPQFFAKQSFYIDNISVQMLIKSQNSAYIQNYVLRSTNTGIPVMFDPTGLYWTISEGKGLLQS